MAFMLKDSYTIEDLLAIMALLRGEGGCPWDREQTHQSIRQNFIEETYEAVEAIDSGDTALLREELGDVLLQVVFHTRMEEEQSSFDFGDVCNDICKKLIVRHPHIFGDGKADTAKEVLSNWEDIKKQTKGQTTQTEVLENVPRVLPALMRSAKVQHRAAKVGFDYPDVERAFRDMRSEVEELDQAIKEQSSAHILEELGDLLFSVVNVARFLEIDPEYALGKACDKFIHRFSVVEGLAKDRGINMPGSSIELLDTLWREAKIKE
ncbi:nucleoside triphosphate pyrophosphohydrolase [Oscillospiraceae bacterium MB08-C2-2]|nr:nucleoside triphosphate pyrophosphohydrolase [Oscillospiraceae bacterium MB08-C2-2]